MKLQLDTDKKTIKLNQDVKFADLVKVLSALLPNKEWKNYTLETNTVIQNWQKPVIIQNWSSPYGLSYWGYTGLDKTVLCAVPNKSNNIKNFDINI